MFAVEKTSKDVKFHIIFVNYEYKTNIKVEPEPDQSDGSFGSGTLPDHTIAGADENLVELGMPG